MAYTYLKYTNLALREVNEVPLTDQQFVNARGLQQFAKEAVNKAYFDVAGESTEWPWLQTQVANTANVEIRRLPANQVWHEIETAVDGTRLEVDWDSFLLTEKDLESTDPLVIASIPETVRMLPMITYEEWSACYRAEDFSQENASIPKYVIRHPSGKFGLSPAPDQDYWVEFNVHNTATAFDLPTEEIPFPEQFAHVITARCAYYLWKFRENHDQANASKAEYERSLKNMKRILLSNKQDRIKAV